MNLAKIYSDATRSLTEDEIIAQQKKELEANTNRAIVQQAKAQWLATKGTAEFLRELEEQAKQFDEVARNSAMSYHTNKNADTIIGALIQAQTIRNIVTYARGH